MSIAIANGLVMFQGQKCLSNKNIHSSSRWEKLGKVVVTSGISTVTSMGAYYAGVAIGTLIGPIGRVAGGLIGAFIGGMGGVLSSFIINKKWKIVNPDKVMNILKRELSEYGYWIQISIIFEELKINYENFINEKPKFFDDFLDYELDCYIMLTGDIIWGNVVLLNILSMLVCLDKDSYSKGSKIITDKVIKFLKCLNMKNFNLNNYQKEDMNFEFIGEKLILKNHLDSIQKVIGSWMEIAQ